MKQAWISIRPWRKELAVAALEAGADAVLLDEGDSPKVKELGLMTTVAPDGDIPLGKDAVIVEISGKEDEQRAASLPRETTVLLRLSDWKVIPLENLIAQRERLMVFVSSADEAATAVQTLEKGADGVVLETEDPSEVRETVRVVRGLSEKIALAKARVTDVVMLGMGDRVCVDTCTNMSPGQGMLVGNASDGFFLVHSESIENPYVEARPFRVNAGAVHAYILLPDSKTKYLGELKAGEEVLLVDHEGNTQTAYVGRSKVERRPLLLVRAEMEDRELTIVLQNAETIRLTAPDGQPISVASLKPGDEVLVHKTGGGRHFGMEVAETITER